MHFLAICTACGSHFANARYELGYRLCLPCGDADARNATAKYTVVPLNKSNYMLVTRRMELRQLNPKRTDA